MSGISPNSNGNVADWRSLYPFKSHWVELTAGQMHYVDEGPPDLNSATPGECLLFVHGNPTWSFHWRRLIQALRPRYRCVAPDHLGCGLSDKPQQWFTLDDHIANLAGLVEKLNLSRVTLVAQDWGGSIGLGALRRLHIQPDRIILFNTAAFPPRYIPWRIRMCRIPLVGRLAVQGGNLFSRAALKMTLARKSQLEPAVRAGYLAPYDCWANRRAVYGFVKDIPGLSGSHDHLKVNQSSGRTLYRIENWLSRLANRPSCLIWGMKDWCFRPDCLDRFLEVWPSAEVHRLADVGHWVLEDAADETLAIIESFLVRQPEDLPRRHQEHKAPSGTSDS